MKEPVYENVRPITDPALRAWIIKEALRFAAVAELCAALAQQRAREEGERDNDPQ